MARITTLSDAEILDHVVCPAKEGMDPDGARAVLGFRFDKQATQHIRRLLQKNNRGTISTEERILLEGFLRVGKIIDLMHAKARLALKEAGLD